MIRLMTVLDMAKCRLRECDYADIRELDVTESDGRLAIHGAVHSFYHKQLAQELLRPLAMDNDLRIVNHLDVMDVLSV